MKLSELKNIIREELQNILTSLNEKSVPEPYNRKKRRRMNSSQISKRDKIGKAMEKNQKIVAKYKKKFGDDWQSYIWAAATNKAMGGKPSGD